MKKIIRKVFQTFGLDVVNHNAYRENAALQRKNEEQRQQLLFNHDRLGLMVEHSQFPEVQGWSELAFLKFSYAKLTRSKAQLFQDLFVLYLFREKRNGFFVEFGATDGVTLSNTFLLEKEYEWSGLLCEPGKVWKDSLAKNRSCSIDNRCVWSKTGDEFSFNEASIPELSTLDMFNDVDYHSESRKDGTSYIVETISLNDLLVQHKAPSQIDYLSVDTEGSEYEILNAFDFTNYNISVITVEHNFSAKRSDIYHLLVGKGYKRVFEKISVFDDWYIKEPLYF